jgi:hypothetical protein
MGGRGTDKPYNWEITDENAENRSIWVKGVSVFLYYSYFSNYNLILLPKKLYSKRKALCIQYLGTKGQEINWWNTVFPLKIKKVGTRSMWSSDRRFPITHSMVQSTQSWFVVLSLLQALQCMQFRTSEKDWRHQSWNTDAKRSPDGWGLPHGSEVNCSVVLLWAEPYQKLPQWCQAMV